MGTIKSIDKITALETEYALQKTSDLLIGVLLKMTIMTKNLLTAHGACLRCRTFIGNMAFWLLVILASDAPFVSARRYTYRYRYSGSSSGGGYRYSGSSSGGGLSWEEILIIIGTTVGLIIVFFC